MVGLFKGGMRLNLKREVDESYDIVFGEKMFEEIAQYLAKTRLADKYAIITDSNVRKLHAGKLENTLKTFGLDSCIFSFEAGEQSKTMDTCMDLMGEMHKLKYGRDSAILALGGGVVGDIAGFMAAIFNRGIPYVQIPTTVLAQADSSVGGKTGIDTPYGKNLIGAFQQPTRVFIDVATLATLHGNEYRNGLAETIKHGVIRDANFFEYLETNLDEILKRENKQSLVIARTNCTIKGNVVEIDPHEKGLRRVLNYGHTVGHAIEKLADFKLPHGHCVSIGMMVAGRISVNQGFMEMQYLLRQEDLLRRVGLPVTIPANISNGEIIEVTSRDKKAKNGMARYCLPEKIGKMCEFGGEYVTHVPNQDVARALNESR
jgi:3-dehydroquinate synthase